MRNRIRTVLHKTVLHKIVLFIFLMCFPLSAQDCTVREMYLQHYLTHYTTQNGLPSDQICQVIDSHSGLLVVTLNDGLYYYNALTFEPTPFRSGLPTQFVEAACYDQQGRLWMACNYAGIYYVDGQTSTPYPFNAQFHKEHFNTVGQWHDGSLLVDVNKVGLFHCTDSSCVNLSKQYELPMGDIVCIEIIADSLAYLLYADMVLRIFDMKRKICRPFFPAEDRILAFHVSKGGALWLMRQGGRIFCRKDGAERYICDTGFLEHTPRRHKFLEDSAGRIWWVNGEGVYRYGPGGLFRFSLNLGRDARLFADRFDSIWITSQGRGLYKLNNPCEKYWAGPGPHKTSVDCNYMLLPLILKTRRSGLWYATPDGGLYQYEYGNITKAAIPDSLLVTALAEDGQGRIWLGTHCQGLYVNDHGAWSRPDWTGVDGGGRITALHCDPAGDLWVGRLSAQPYNYGLQMIPAKNVSNPVAGGQAYDTLFTSMYIDSTATIWFGTADDGLLSGGRDGRLQDREEKFRFPYLSHIENLFSYRGEIWGSTYTSIVNYSPETQRLQHFMLPKYLPEFLKIGETASFQWSGSDYIYVNNALALTTWGNAVHWNPAQPIYGISAVEKEEGGALWIGSYRTGLHQIRGDSVRRIGPAEGLDALRISTLHLDDEQCLWVGTLGEGVFVNRGTSFTQSSVMARMGRDVSALHRDRLGRLWVGTLTEGVVRYDPADDIYQRIIGGHAPVWGFGEHASGEIYACVGNGDFIVINGQTVSHLPRRMLVNHRALQETFLNQCINLRWQYLNFQRLLSPGLSCLDLHAEQVHQFTVRDGLPSHEVTDIETTEDGRLWVSTRNAGLAVFNGKQFVHQPGTGDDGMSRFIDLLPASDGGIWALSEDEGLLKVYGDSLQGWGADTKVITSQATKLVDDLYNDPLMIGRKGLNYFNQGEIYGEQLILTTEKETATQSVALCDTSRQLWLPTADGLACFPLNRILPSIQIHSCQLGNRQQIYLPLETSMSGAYNETVSVIEFTGYHSRFAAQSIDYSWRLIQPGDTAAWSRFAQKRKVIYTQLKAGRQYTFQVRAKTPDGCISDPPALLRLKLAAKPLLLREGFWAAVLLLASCFLTGLYAFRNSKIRRVIRQKRFNPYTAGEPVLNPDLFFGRQGEMERIHRLLYNNSMMITGERRIGKTSLLKQMETWLSEKSANDMRFFPVYIDLQGVQEWDFFHLIMEELARGVRRFTALPRLTYEKKAEDYHYRDFNADFRRLITAMTRAHKGACKLVLLIDEADAMNAYDQVVHAQFRRIFMQEYSQHFSAVITGTALITAWNRPESPWWNLFTQTTLGPISERSARHLIVSPAEGIFVFTRGAIKEILAITGCKPYLIQVLCVELVGWANRYQRRRITKAIVHAVRSETGRLFNQQAECQ